MSKTPRTLFAIVSEVTGNVVHTAKDPAKLKCWLDAENRDVRMDGRCHKHVIVQYNRAGEGN